ncbi:MAG: hypothetical protein ACJ79H_00405 [Myxococcales bacterium]
MAALILPGCPGDFEKQSEIVKLRVLAVQAEPAELIVEPGQPLPRTTLTALAVEPSDAPVAMEYALCTVQEAVPPPDVDCPGTQGIPLAPAGPTSAVLDLGDPRAIALALQLARDAGVADPGALPPDGVPVLVGFRATAPAHTLPDGGPPGADGGDLQVFQGLTTVTARGPGAPPNQNPALAGLRMGDAGVEIAADGTSSAPSSTTQRLAPVPAPGSKEPADGGVEPLGYSFFATAGSISALRSTDTTATGQPGDTFVDWTTPPGRQQVRLWVVVRDGRGGVGWIARFVEVTPPAAR